MKIEDTFVKGLHYPENKIKKAVENDKLLNLDLDLSNFCNLKCKYCDKTHIGEEHIKKKNELSLNESLNIIDQAHELGCENIQIIGAGEPTLDPNFWKIVEYASNKGIRVVIYTNGAMITKKFAERLHNLKTSIVLKFNSFNKKIQDDLVGLKGYHEMVKKSLNNLLSVGFNKTAPPRLAIDCVATPLNYDDVFKIFEFCRKNNISPQITALIPHGEALERGFVLSKEDYEKIYKKAYEYDRKKGFFIPINYLFWEGFNVNRLNMVFMWI